MAQADEPWEGTYAGDVGIIRLVQDGDRVYGDYETRRGNWGIIEARVSQDGMTIRGTYQNLKAKTDNALLEFRLTEDGMIGSYTQFHNMRTVSWEGARWTGQVVSTNQPALKYASAQELNYAERFPGTVARLRNWAMFGQTTDVSRTVLWDERGYTGLRDGWASNHPQPFQSPNSPGNASAAEEELMDLPLPPGVRDRGSQRVETNPRSLKRGVMGDIERKARGVLGGLLGGSKKPDDDDERGFPGEMHRPDDGGDRTPPQDDGFPDGDL